MATSLSFLKSIITRPKKIINTIPSVIFASKMTTPAHTLSKSINRSASYVYGFIANPANLPQWAPGLCLSIQKTNKENTWLAQTANGPVSIRFAEQNKFGIIDHHVTLATGQEVYVPLRVIANNEGSEVIFTVFRLPGMNDEQFKNDVAAVQKDLDALKLLLEQTKK